MAFADPAVLPPLRHQRPAGFEQSMRLAAQPRDTLRLVATGQDPRDFLEVVECVAVRLVRRAESLLAGGDRCRCMHLCDALAEFLQFVRLDVARLQQLGEFEPRIELHHPQRVLERRGVGGADAGCSGRSRDRHDVDVQPRRVTPVQAQLFAAEFKTTFGRRIVDETEPQRFLHLVGEGPGQEHPGDVGLDAGHGSGHGMQRRIGSRVLHRGGEGSLDCRGIERGLELTGVHARFGSRRALPAVYSCHICAGCLRSILMVRRPHGSTMKTSTRTVQQRDSAS